MKMKSFYLKNIFLIYFRSEKSHESFLDTTSIKMLPLPACAKKQTPTTVNKLSKYKSI